jgi:hypothetical protein
LKEETSDARAAPPDGDEVRVCILSAPQSREGITELERLLREVAEVHNLDIVRLFGDYDYIALFHAENTIRTGSIVQDLREKLGPRVVQTVTLIEWKR